jgi:four helix bundle protein
MATVKRFGDLLIWQFARELCHRIGIIIDKHGFKKNFRLIHQIEGSSGSIMDNIAEGFERGTRGEFLQFLGYAKGSSGEFRSQLYRALDRKYIDQQDYNEINSIAIRVSSMIQKLISYLLNSDMKGSRKYSKP